MENEATESGSLGTAGMKGKNRNERVSQTERLLWPERRNESDS